MTWITYPGLSRQEFSNPTSLPWKRAPAIHGLHSTEGDGYPSAAVYANGTRAPHFTIDMWARTSRQHYPLTEAAWALRAPAGVSTNTMGVIQYEIIGTCAGTGNVRSILAAGDDELAYLAGLLATVSAATGIPLTSTVRWLPYPASYGNKSGQRLSAAAFYAYRGVLGHQHVPGNDHGDPGDFNVSRLLDLARGGAVPVANPVTPPPPSRFPRNVPEAQATQRALHQTADGDWGDGTENALGLVRAAINNQFPQGVAAVQRVIGTPDDNRWGPKSKAALVATIRALQRAWGASPDGLWGNQTEAAMIRAHARNYKAWER